MRSQLEANNEPQRHKDTEILCVSVSLDRREITMTDNPYTATPTKFSHAIPETDFAQMSLLAIARRVFLAWEKLRIAYVILLALITVLFTVLFTGVTGIWNLRLLRMIVLGAMVANVAYFAGPTIETYVRWLGYSRAWPGWIMFVGGTLLSIVLAIGVLATELLPDQP